jgi:hypothetical protein
MVKVVCPNCQYCRDIPKSVLSAQKQATCPKCKFTFTIENNTKASVIRVTTDSELSVGLDTKSKINWKNSCLVLFVLAGLGLTGFIAHKAYEYKREKGLRTERAVLKTYQEFIAATKEADIIKLKKLVVSQKSNSLDSAEAKKSLENLKDVTSSPKVVSVVIQERTAVVSLEDGASIGKMLFVIEDGVWKVVKQEWSIGNIVNKEMEKMNAQYINGEADITIDDKAYKIPYNCTNADLDLRNPVNARLVFETDKDSADYNEHIPKVFIAMDATQKGNHILPRKYKDKALQNTPKVGTLLGERHVAELLMTVDKETFVPADDCGITVSSAYRINRDSQFSGSVDGCSMKSANDTAKKINMKFSIKGAPGSK